MSKFLLPILLAAALCTLPGCGLWPGRDRKPKSSAHLYEGDAPSIHFSEKPEAAGGRINTY